MTTTTISVPEIHCDHCKESIEGALSRVAGVNSAEVSVPDRNVSIDYDGSVVDLVAIRAAIEDQGFEVPA